MCIFPSLIAYLFFDRGIELIGSAATGMYMNVLPLLGSGLAILFLGEELYLFHIAGMTLIGGGILWAGRGQAPLAAVPARSADRSELRSATDHVHRALGLKVSHSIFQLSGLCAECAAPSGGCLRAAGETLCSHRPRCQCLDYPAFLDRAPLTGVEQRRQLALERCQIGDLARDLDKMIAGKRIDRGAVMRPIIR